VDEYYDGTENAGPYRNTILWKDNEGSLDIYPEAKLGKPFATKTGKFEVSSPVLSEPERIHNELDGKHYDALGNDLTYLQDDWGYYKPASRLPGFKGGPEAAKYKGYPVLGLWPIPVYQICWGSSEHWVSKDLPLNIHSTHSRYRTHSLWADHPYGVNETYVHRALMSVADARQRGIKDNDWVRVFNDRGEILIRARVTHRMSPGHLIVRVGQWMNPNTSKPGPMFTDRCMDGSDDTYGGLGGTITMVLGQDLESICKTPMPAIGAVQIEKL
jgi:anaerobic selenocysteine-containing dehydrogenase